tara:strand:- start:1411 stop:1608 length:198 start_codon:yes stop_codon:yes gene_type:complete
MQKALDHLEKHKVFIETLGTDMIPLSEAYKAVELSIDEQIQDTLSLLQEQLGGLTGDLQNEEEND